MRISSQNFKKYSAGVLLAAALLVIPAMLPVNAADPVSTGQQILGNAQETASQGGYPENPPTLTSYVGALIKGALLLTGSLFLVLAIYGGYRWMTARGKSDLVEKGKEIIISAVIGMLIVLTAYAVAEFVIEKALEASKYQN